MIITKRNIIFALAVIIFSILLLREPLLQIWNSANRNLEQFQQTDLAKLFNEIKREILTSGPLRIGGAENKVILVKAKIIAETNVQRFDNGMLPPLIENEKLNAAAMAKAQDMFARQYFEHNSPNGTDPGELVKQYGYDYIVSGENLILGNFADEEEVVQKWMDSPGHRANILHARFLEIGVAMVKGQYEGHSVWIGVQEFGLPFASCPAPSQVLKNQIEAGKADLDMRVVQIEAKKEEVENTNHNSPQYNALVDEYNEMVKEYNARVQEMKALIAKYNSQISALNACVKGI